MTTTFADRIAARLARYDTPDDRRIAALAAIEVAINPALDLPDAEIVADVRAVLAALERAQSVPDDATLRRIDLALTEEE